VAEVGWRSTTLGIASKHCPRALDFYEAGAPYDRGIFAIGTAAHAILEAMGKASAASGQWLQGDEAAELVRRECERLITTGRDFEGVQEPPLPAEAVWRGRDLALSFVDQRMLQPGYRYETGLAVNRGWQLCPFGPEAWLRARIDCAGTRMPDWFEDDAGGPILDVIDYKSSYAARDGEMSTLQRKIQGVLAWLAWGEGHDALRLVVVNFRLNREYELLVYPHEPEGARVMERWRHDIESEIKARQDQRGADGRRPAVPGAGCMGCPYLQQCPEAQAYLLPVHGTASPEEMARRYAVLLAQLEALEEPLRIATIEEPVQIPGAIVGYEVKEQQTLERLKAAELLSAEWWKSTKPRDLGAAMASLPGLINGMKPGRAQAASLLNQLHKGSDEERDKRAVLLAQITGSRNVSEFGVHRVKEEE
jgi:hypothetical protein